MASNGIGAQFKYLDAKHPELWPLAPRILLYLFVFLLSLALFWMWMVRPYAEEYESEKAKEATLKEELVSQSKAAAKFDVLKRQEDLLNERLVLLKQQLPTQTEMDMVLRQVAQAGNSRGLKVSLFKPSEPKLEDFYAVINVDMRVIGKYHQLGAFLADLASIPRILSVESFSMNANSQNNKIDFNGALRVVRALSEEEIAEMKKDDKKKDTGKKK